MDTKVVDVEMHPFENEAYKGVRFSWTDDRGFFGQYTLYKNIDDEDGKWLAETETMEAKDSEDKPFLEEIIKAFMKDIEVIE